MALESGGDKAEHVVAFARRAAGHELVVVVPRLTARLAGGRAEPPTRGGAGADPWGDTFVALRGAPLHDVLGGRRVVATDAVGLRVGDALASFPWPAERQIPLPR